MMKCYEKRDRLLGGMYEYISDVVTLSIKQSRKLILWGCGKGGAFVRHLVCDIDGRTGIEYYIDEHMILPCGSEDLKIYRKSLLWYLDKKEYIVLLSIRKDDEVERFLRGAGYVKDRDYYDVRSDIGGSYLEYLEKSIPDIDFSYVTKEDRPDLYLGEYFESKPFDHSSIDRVFSEIESLPCDKSFFDIGCGKGQMLMMAALYGFEIIGGIDFNCDIVKRARNNMKLLGIDAEVVSGDATEYTEIDRYSVFFLYNPFGEESIRKVIGHICDSFYRKERSIFVVYGNPFYHHSLIEKKECNLYRQVRVDLHDPLLNIYRIGG